MSDNEGSHCLDILLSQRSPLTDYVPPSDDDGGGKATPPTDGEFTPDATIENPTPSVAGDKAIGNPDPSVADATPAAGTLDAALPPKTALALDRLDTKWTGLFEQFLVNRRQQQESQCVLEELWHAEDNRQWTKDDRGHADYDRQWTQEAASLSTLEEMMTAALASLTTVVNKAVNPFKAKITAAVEEI